MTKHSRVRCAGHLARTGEKRNAYMVLLQEQKGRWKYNIEMDIGIWIGFIRLYIGTSSLILVSITEELLRWKSSGSGSRKPRLTAVGIRYADHATPSILKSWH
jgi:hypothetical protein